MYIYLDESYNLQKKKGRQFISISGFIVDNDLALLKKWKIARQDYLKLGKRIHAADSNFSKLRIQSLRVLKQQRSGVISMFQDIGNLPNQYFKNNYLDFEAVYLNLIKNLIQELPLNKQDRVVVIIDSRPYKGGNFTKTLFQNEIIDFLNHRFPGSVCTFKIVPSYSDPLLELADFISNTLYQFYIKDDFSFKGFNLPVLQIKNPLCRRI